MDPIDPPVQHHPSWHFELHVRVATPGRPWRATLVSDGGAGRIDFHTPEALVRHLAQLTEAPQPRGLR